MAELQNVKARISETLRHLYARISTRDFDQVEVWYTENCRIFGLDGTAYEGRENCARALRSIFSVTHYAGIKHDVEEVMHTGGADHAVSRDRFTMFDESGKNLGSGKSLLVWKLVHGYWLIDQDTRNYNFKTDKTLVIELCRAWADALSRKDYRLAASYYTPDCAYMPSDIPTVNGKEEVEKTFRALCEESELSGTVIFKPDFDFRELGEGLASLQGTTSMTDNDGKIVWHCYYLVIFKKLEDGRWYIHNDLFTEIP